MRSTATAKKKPSGETVEGDPFKTEMVEQLRVLKLVKRVSNTPSTGDSSIVVSGEMKVVEKWRFEIPCSSVGFSSHASL